MQAHTGSLEAKGEAESSCTVRGVRVETMESEDVAATEEAAKEATDAEMATAGMTAEEAAHAAKAEIATEACSRGRDGN